MSLASWDAGSVLFEQGAYIDLAFCVVEGEVEVYLEGVGEGDGGARPIFDLSRTMIGEMQPEAATGATVLCIVLALGIFAPVLQRMVAHWAIRRR